ncbi:hypothetical protein [Bosea sp. ASV33]|uniref:hypothetical protein n=1 Tax=Bosea sp. ASV33 TaxID=2795106 RepID=UPI0018ED729E|nr:hypothetical protein [Bosea sp. ASV33]
MFAGTLGRSQFFIKSGLLGSAEAILLLICIGVQYEAFMGPPGQGRYRLAATASLISAFFGFKRVGFAIRRNRDAGGGDVLPGLYAIGVCSALVLQAQMLIVRTSDSPFNSAEYSGLLGLFMFGAWIYLQFAPSVPASERAEAGVTPALGRLDGDDAPAAPSHLSLAMEEAISGKKPIPAMPASVQPQGFLGSVRRPPPPPQRTQFGRRGVK